MVIGHVSSYMLEVLHWLPIRQPIEYRVASMVWRCQLGLVPTYLIDLCRPVSGSRISRSLRSSEREVALSPVHPYHYHAEPRLFCCGPDGME